MDTDTALDPQFDDVFVGAASTAFDSGPLWSVGDLAKQVVTLYQVGKIDENKAMQALGALVLVGPDQSKWAMGSTTFRWYRKLPGGGWKLARAPRNPDELQPAADEAMTAALWLLGVDPSTVETSDSPTQGGPVGGDQSLLESLVGGYGD